jgi:hypothetical protein
MALRTFLLQCIKKDCGRVFEAYTPLNDLRRWIIEWKCPHCKSAALYQLPSKEDVLPPEIIKGREKHTK